METKLGTKQKILVVDDNNENIRIIGSILRQHGYQVGFATHGKQALDILKSKDEDYDLLLLDVNMPGMTGFEVCRSIREVDLLKNLPIIFLTANTGYEHILEGFTSGGQDYVTKPFHPGELLARIGTHLELKKNREQLQQMNEILEGKVKERTRQLEEANQRLEIANLELEELDHAKAGFLRIISHEINTPLNGIIGFAEVLSEQLAGSEYFSFVKYLKESAYRLNDFAQTSLLITELRTSPNKFILEVNDLRKPIYEAITKLKADFEKRDLKLKYSGYPQELLVSCDSELIQTGMKNILKNAIDHSEKGAEIIISVVNENKKVKVFIQDGGPGFSESAFQNLFKPFSTKNEHIDKNKGLGLMLVKMIIDLHRGHIEIFNNDNAGGTVVLTFDCCRKE